MMYKKIIFSVLFLFLSFISYAQIGIGTEEPTYEFETKGTVRFQDLEQQSQYTHYRQVRSDDEGRLTAIQFYQNGLIFKNIVKQFMTNVVIVPVAMPQDLGVKLTVEVDAHSETTVILTYNVPIYLNVNTASVYPHFGGVQLIKTEGIQTQIMHGGSRKFSFALSYPNAINETKRGMFIDGKYVDVIKNTTNTKKIVEYSLKGFTDGPNFTALFFGDSISDLSLNSMGVGVFSAMIFDKKL
ncbi:hypothetical protein [Myroides fluvii]|uniref:hypothetical protein n=1 Tax=Myroides fluvii TaxID=2572594 RepID=UPI00131E5D6F|nr:hypothetical protein [Myroides fluvii]